MQYLQQDPNTKQDARHDRLQHTSGEELTPVRQLEDTTRLPCSNSQDFDRESLKESRSDVTTPTDILGQFGLYQLSLTLLTFIRYINVAMMTNTGALIAPEQDFWCLVPDSITSQLAKPQNISVQDYLNKKCHVYLVGGKQVTCNKWTYNTTLTGPTLTDSFDLVCDRDYLRSTFQSSITIGLVIASIVCGSFSDRHGRYRTVIFCFICSLIAGSVSYFANSLLLYTIARSLCSFGDLGLVASLSTMLLETIGNKFRGSIGIIVFTGWAFGVMIMPWITDYFRNFRDLMLCTVALHIITLPWLLTLGESVRWLLVNGKLDEGLQEFQRICNWNRFYQCKRREKMIVMEEVESKFHKMRRRYLDISEKHLRERDQDEAKLGSLGRYIGSVTGGLTKVNQLFKKKELAAASVTLTWTTFNSELLYMLFIMINTEIGDNIKLNYAIGGVMEVLATVLSILMVWLLKRKFSLVLTLMSISSLCFTLAFTHHLGSVSIWILNFTKLAISTLSSLVYVVTTEYFPTNLRQTGIGVSGTIGSMGAVLAPFIRTELTNAIGLTSVMLLLVFPPITAACLIPFFLRETKDSELDDDINEE